MSVIKSIGAKELVIRDFRPANEWTESEVNLALQECLMKKDIFGAEALFSRLNQEFIVFYEHKFGTKTDEPQDSPVSRNCKKALEIIRQIKNVPQG